jgi:hypothetical protein
MAEVDRIETAAKESYAHSVGSSDSNAPRAGVAAPVQAAAPRRRLAVRTSFNSAPVRYRR